MAYDHDQSGSESSQENVISANLKEGDSHEQPENKEAPVTAESRIFEWLRDIQPSSPKEVAKDENNFSAVETSDKDIVSSPDGSKFHIKIEDTKEAPSYLQKTPPSPKSLSPTLMDHKNRCICFSEKSDGNIPLPTSEGENGTKQHSINKLHNRKRSPTLVNPTNKRSTSGKKSDNNVSLLSGASFISSPQIADEPESDENILSPDSVQAPSSSYQITDKCNTPSYKSDSDSYRRLPDEISRSKTKNSSLVSNSSNFHSPGADSQVSSCLSEDFVPRVWPDNQHTSNFKEYIEILFPGTIHRRSSRQYTVLPAHELSASSDAHGAALCWRGSAKDEHCNLLKTVKEYLGTPRQKELVEAFIKVYTRMKVIRGQFQGLESFTEWRSKVSSQLSQIAFSGCLSILKDLLEETDWPGYWDGNKDTALCWAAFAGNYEMVLFLDKGLNRICHERSKGPPAFALTASTPRACKRGGFLRLLKHTSPKRRLMRCEPMASTMKIAAMFCPENLQWLLDNVWPENICPCCCRTIFASACEGIYPDLSVKALLGHKRFRAKLLEHYDIVEIIQNYLQLHPNSNLDRELITKNLLILTSLYETETSTVLIAEAIANSLTLVEFSFSAECPELFRIPLDCLIKSGMEYLPR